MLVGSGSCPISLAGELVGTIPGFNKILDKRSGMEEWSGGVLPKATQHPMISESPLEVIRTRERGLFMSASSSVRY